MLILYHYYMSVHVHIYCILFTLYMQCRNPKRFFWFEWVFLAVATLSVLGVLGVTIQRFDHFERIVDNISINLSNGTVVPAQCSTWVCTSDFIFAVALLVNLGIQPRH